LAQAEVEQREMFGLGHRAGIEGDDLVVVPVGVEECRCGELVVDQLDPGRVDALLLHPGPVLAEVLPGRRDDQRLLAQQRQRVGDIAGHAAAHPAHGVDQEADCQHMDFVRQNVILEVAGKVHNIVICQ